MRRQDYTVGWIYAVQTEYVAACELLDEEHPSLPTYSPHDDNAYTSIRIGDHHIVIACLPEGRYGIASAASVATFGLEGTRPSHVHLQKMDASDVGHV